LALLPLALSIVGFLLMHWGGRRSRWIPLASLGLLLLSILFLVLSISTFTI
jgi:hypothetical protein